MATAPPKPIPNLRPTTDKPVPTLCKQEPKFQAPRVILNAVEGWGKTTCAAYTGYVQGKESLSALLQVRGENGYDTLLGNGFVPTIPTVHIDSWPVMFNVLDQAYDLACKSSLKYLSLDAIGGFERICHEFVCERDYHGDWGEKGFTAYQKGYDLSVSEWIKLLQRLEEINSRGVMILFLGHVQIRPFRNPMGADFDRYVCDVHQKTWSITHKWADAVFFGIFESVVDLKKTEDPIKGKGKGIGGTQRILYTERRDSFDAKNRYGMPELIEIPNDPAQSWNAIWQHIKPKSPTGTRRNEDGTS